VLACSALKASYRQLLSGQAPPGAPLEPAGGATTAWDTAGHPHAPAHSAAPEAMPEAATAPSAEAREAVASADSESCDGASSFAADRGLNFVSI
jgi:hypothetical protein